MGNFKMNDDYVDVAERIRQFKELYPDGSLQTIGVEWRESLVIATAAAYRTPDDDRPGIGTASEPVPGKTPYTRDSELMNAETSAWGRAIVAVGIPTKRIASSDEVRNRDADRQERQTGRDEQAERAPAQAQPAGNGHITKAEAKRLHEMLHAKGRESSWFLAVLKEKKGIGDGEHLTSIPSDQYEALLKVVVDFADPEPKAPLRPQEPESAPPTVAEAPEPPEPETDEQPPGMDAEAYKAHRAAQTAEAAPKPRKATVTGPQLTRLGAICGDLEAAGVGQNEWRTYLFAEEGVRSRKELTKTAATRMIDALGKWATDMQTLGERAAS